MSNLQLGKLKRKKPQPGNDFDSFKGKLKMFYIFPTYNQDIRTIYGRFNSELRGNLSEFPSVLEINPTLSMNRG